MAVVTRRMHLPPSSHADRKCVRVCGKTFSPETKDVCPESRGEREREREKISKEDERGRKNNSIKNEKPHQGFKRILCELYLSQFSPT